MSGIVHHSVHALEHQVPEEVWLMWFHMLLGAMPDAVPGNIVVAEVPQEDGSLLVRAATLSDSAELLQAALTIRSGDWTPRGGGA